MKFKIDEYKDKHQHSYYQVTVEKTSKIKYGQPQTTFQFFEVPEFKNGTLEISTIDTKFTDRDDAIEYMNFYKAIRKEPEYHYRGSTWNSVVLHVKSTPLGSTLGYNDKHKELAWVQKVNRDTRHYGHTWFDTKEKLEKYIDVKLDGPPVYHSEIIEDDSMEPDLTEQDIDAVGDDLYNQMSGVPGLMNTIDMLDVTVDDVRLDSAMDTLDAINKVHRLKPKPPASRIEGYIDGKKPESLLKQIGNWFNKKLSE